MVALRSAGVIAINHDQAPDVRCTESSQPVESFLDVTHVFSLQDDNVVDDWRPTETEQQMLGDFFVETYNTEQAGPEFCDPHYRRLSSISVDAMRYSNNELEILKSRQNDNTTVVAWKARYTLNGYWDGYRGSTNEGFLASTQRHDPDHTSQQHHSWFSHQHSARPGGFPPHQSSGGADHAGWLRRSPRDEIQAENRGFSRSTNGNDQLRERSTRSGRTLRFHGEEEGDHQPTLLRQECQCPSDDAKRRPPNHEEFLLAFNNAVREMRSSDHSTRRFMPSGLRYIRQVAQVDDNSKDLQRPSVAFETTVQLWVPTTTDGSSLPLPRHVLESALLDAFDDDHSHHYGLRSHDLISVQHVELMTRLAPSLEGHEIVEFTLAGICRHCNLLDNSSPQSPWDRWLQTAVSQVQDSFETNARRRLAEPPSNKQDLVDVVEYDCSSNKDQFDATVYVRLWDDENVNLTWLEENFMEAYNLLTFTLCDNPLFRNVVSAKATPLAPNQTITEEALDALLLLETYSDMNQSDVDLLNATIYTLEVVAECDKCNSTTPLFHKFPRLNETTMEQNSTVAPDTTTEAITLAPQFGGPFFLPGSNTRPSLGIARQGSDPTSTCVCPKNDSNAFRAPTAEEFQFFFNERLNLSLGDPSAAMQVAEEQRIDCGTSTDFFSSYAYVSFDIQFIDISEQDMAKLQQTFAETYNELSYKTCDKYYRKVVNATILIGPSSDLIPLRRNLQETETPSMMIDSSPTWLDLDEPRMLNQGLVENNVCKCPAGVEPGINGSPSEDEFLEAFNQRLESLNLSSVDSAEQVVEGYEVDCPSNASIFSSAVFSDVTIDFDKLTLEEKNVLEATFRDTYNALTYFLCDGDFRSVVEVDLQRELQMRSQVCICPDGVDIGQGPTIEQFQTLFNQRLDELVAGGILTSVSVGTNVAIVTMMVEGQQVDCIADVEQFESAVYTGLRLNELQVDGAAMSEIESGFMSLYNTISFEGCDSFFRRVTSVELVVGQNFVSRRLQQDAFGPGEDASIAQNLTLASNDTDSSNALEGEACYCAAGIEPDGRGPSPEEFAPELDEIIDMATGGNGIDNTENEGSGSDDIIIAEVDVSCADLSRSLDIVDARYSVLYPSEILTLSPEDTEVFLSGNYPAAYNVFRIDTCSPILLQASIVNGARRLQQGASGFVTIDSRIVSLQPIEFVSETVQLFRDETHRIAVAQRLLELLNLFLLDRSPDFELFPTPTLAPSGTPSAQPTFEPTPEPTNDPTSEPTVEPTLEPTSEPTFLPSPQPTFSPTVSPSAAPSLSPSDIPTKAPTLLPSSIPTVTPGNPSASPTTATPSSPPSTIPTVSPSEVPSLPPSSTPSSLPSRSPSASPSISPSDVPTDVPTASPSLIPTVTPGNPSASPTTATPSLSPSTRPTGSPSEVPSVPPSTTPSSLPSSSPTTSPSLSPSISPSDVPTDIPTASPTSIPTVTPGAPSASPTTSTPSSSPSGIPTGTPSSVPTPPPSNAPTAPPTNAPTAPPTNPPTAPPTNAPTEPPTNPPTDMPSSSPSQSQSPSSAPSNLPSLEPSSVPSPMPSLNPSSAPSVVPSSSPTTLASFCGFLPFSEAVTVGFDDEISGVSNPELLSSFKTAFSATRNETCSPWLVGVKLLRVGFSEANFIAETDRIGGDPFIRSGRQKLYLDSMTSSTGVPAVYVRVDSVPTSSPTGRPSFRPSLQPSSSPSSIPSLSPSGEPSERAEPSLSPSEVPTLSSRPSASPSLIPSMPPSLTPSEYPTASPHPSGLPTVSPSKAPSDTPSVSPTSSSSPSVSPSTTPSTSPSSNPSEAPSLSSIPSVSPSRIPSTPPSFAPSPIPSASPSYSPSFAPSDLPSFNPSPAPSDTPSESPTFSSSPSISPSITPSPSISSPPSQSPTLSSNPSVLPSSIPSTPPSTVPSAPPTLSTSPSVSPSSIPSKHPVIPKCISHFKLQP
ncbi:expressed unknown protein [Seminavis robusta]|uniref:Uncharacterized protein n=1 Tax=Seminavis robusta TaxID=568900 RepID=A0A9N8EHL5_9STRA|nr:expressed unknown protein [Seminavis robusta]|eukprot:Sro1146_g246320.1 n/a (1955) ;mRNA; r:16179-22616